jgi:hypothetical protein
MINHHHGVMIVFFASSSSPVTLQNITPSGQGQELPTPKSTNHQHQNPCDGGGGCKEF